MLKKIKNFLKRRKQQKEERKHMERIVKSLDIQANFKKVK